MPCWEAKAANSTTNNPAVAAKIGSKLGLDNLEGFWFAAVQCECGHTYGAFEFLEQGIRAHGLESVKAVFALKHAKFLQVNPSFVPVCPACGRNLKRDPGGITYEGPNLCGLQLLRGQTRGGPEERGVVNPLGIGTARSYCKSQVVNPRAR